MYSPGECIIIETDEKTGDAHLFVVVLEANQDTDQTILLPLCTIRPGRFYDKTVELSPGEGGHDFIKDPTYVDYYDGRIETKAKIDEMIVLGTARRRKPNFDDNTCQKIFGGIQKSKHTPFIVSSYYEDHLFGSR